MKSLLSEFESQKKENSEDVINAQVGKETNKEPVNNQTIDDLRNGSFEYILVEG